MLDHFYTIMSMASDNAKQAKLAMVPGSPIEMNDENAFEKRSFRIAAKCAPPDSIQTGFQPDLKRLGIYFSVYLSIGTAVFYTVRDDFRGHKTNNFIDSLYMMVVTMTTVGYDDIAPHTPSASLVCSVFITAGLFLVGVAVKIAAKYLVVKQQMVMVNAIRTARKIGPVEAIEELENLKVDYSKCKISLIAMVVHFVVGIFVLLTVEGMDFTDTIYCAITTMTTTGFGDKTFQEEFGRMFAVFWISTGTSNVGQLFLYVAEVYTDIETRKLAKHVITSNMIAKKDLEAADDIEDDNKVYGAADMILYKLKQMEKIKQDDISVATKDLDHVIKDIDVDDANAGKSAQEK